MTKLPDPIAVRLSILEMLHRSRASHLGSSMSAVEMLIAAFAAAGPDKIRKGDADRSRVIISKGHGACATYAVMAHHGILPFELLETYHRDGSLLAGHVSHAVPHVEHSTGALGHGINVAVGCAIGMRSRGYTRSRVITIVGDGEIQEGSVWEALMLAAHLKLGNLAVLVDNNRISSITDTDAVLDMKPLVQRFRGFGVESHEVDGHDAPAIYAALERAGRAPLPTVLICNTVKGKDVPFAEGQAIWHYRSLNDELFAQAKAHLQQKCETGAPA